MYLDWNLLQTFAVIVQSKSISRAATKLRLTQPAVSSALRRLEDQLGHRLIDRGGAKFELTAEGQILFRESVEILARFNRLRETLADTRREISGVIKLALASHVVCPFFDQVLKEFHESYPSVHYQLEVGKSAKISEDVLQGTVSAGVCLVYREHDKLQYQKLFTEEFGLFCGRSHRFFGKSGLSVRDLAKENFVSFQTDQMDDALWAVALMRNQHRMKGDIVGVSPNLEEVRRLIAAGIGIGPLPIHAVEADVERGLLWRLPPYTNAPAISVYVVTNPNCNHSRAEVLFLEFLSAKITDIREPDRTFPRT